jgi:hypothetical protein
VGFNAEDAEGTEKKEPHGSCGREVCSSKLVNDKSLGVFQGGDGGFARNRGKVIEEFIEGFAAFQIVKKILKGHAGAAKDGSSAENLGVFGYDV